MLTTTSRNNLLPVGVEYFYNYAPYHKIHIISTKLIPSESKTIDELKIFHINSPNKLSKQIFHKSKPSTDRHNFQRYLLPIVQHHSTPLHEEQYVYNEKRSSIENSNNVDMRLFIIRHGERVDRFFGSDWYLFAFNRRDKYRPYHKNFPLYLPLRTNKYFWALDTPLTSKGLQAAEQLGHTLAKKKINPNHVYSSPAMRCIMTTIQILKGLGLGNKRPIRIEPGLLELGASRFGMNIFFHPSDWYQQGINVDLSYQPVVTFIPPIERENEYYLRSKRVIREIEKSHNNTSTNPTDILIVAHATSPDTLTWDLVGKTPNVNDLYALSMNVAYLQVAVAEREQDTQKWNLK